MRLWTGGRATGKTTKTVEWLLEGRDRYVLSAFGRRHYEPIVREVLDRKYSRLTQEQKALRAEEALTRVHDVRPRAVPPGLGRGRQEWMVDDLDHLLAALVGGTVVAATTNTPVDIVDVRDA